MAWATCSCLESCRRHLRAAAGAQYAVTLVDLDMWNLTEAQVERDWHNIDIFVRDCQHRLAVLVENKLDNGEQSGQLEREKWVDGVTSAQCRTRAPKCPR